MARKTLKNKDRARIPGKRSRRSKGRARSRTAAKASSRPPIAVFVAIGMVVVGLAAYGLTMFLTGATGKTSDKPSYTADQITLVAKESSPECFTKAVTCG